MKIRLTYAEPGTKITAYIHTVIYDESEINEALEELTAARDMGYEIREWKLLHEKDAV